MRRYISVGLALTIMLGVAGCAGGRGSATPSFQIPARSATAAWGDVDEQTWWTKVVGPEQRGPKEPQTFDISGDVLFDVDSSTLSPMADTQLGRIASVAENSHVLVHVVGYTDSDGTAAHNQKLSDARARSVADWLVHRGVAHTRVTTKGLGEADPLAPNDTSEHKAENRRVMITITP